AWMYKTPHVAFLNFVKMGHGLKSGSKLTLLFDAAPFRAGEDVVVIEKNKTEAWISTAKNFAVYEKMFKDSTGETITGKAADVISSKFLSQNFAIKVPLEYLSKQVVQFLTAKVPAKDIEEMGKVVGQTTVEMVVAHETNFYPKEPGLRYPSEK